MLLLAIDFDNLHQILQNLYVEMMPLCSKMTGVARGLAGLGALFYVAYRVWQALARAEPVDVFPLLRPFALGLCIMFFPTLVLGTLNSILSPVVKGTHTILESQTFDMNEYRAQKDKLELEAMKRNPETAYLVDKEAFDNKLDELGVLDAIEACGMYVDRAMYNMKKAVQNFFRELLELMFNAAALVALDFRDIEKVETVKAELEDARVELQDKQSELETKQVELQQKSSEAAALLANLESNIDAYKQVQDQYAQQEQAVQSQIDKQVEELRRQEEQNKKNDPSYDPGKVNGATGSMMWPCPSCHTITSPFGWRYHPIYQTQKYHSGVDIGASYGATIVAADGGTIITAGTVSGYGNCVVINHGNGITTLYGHMSSIAVRVGQKVSKGQTIGYVGSTGNSTGPHLHWEVTVNGVRQNPLNYAT